MQERVMIFIDGANLFHGCSNYKKGYKIDMLKLRDELVGGRKLVSSHYYAAIPRENSSQFPAQKRFLDMLSYNSFNVTAVPLKTHRVTVKCDYCGMENHTTEQVEKGVDIALATDLISFAMDDQYDTAIIVSGDYDYFRAIQEVQRRGKKVEIAYFLIQGITEEFIQVADNFISLNGIADKITKE